MSVLGGIPIYVLEVCASQPTTGDPDLLYRVIPNNPGMAGIDHKPELPRRIPLHQRSEFMHADKRVGTSIGKVFQQDLNTDLFPSGQQFLQRAQNRIADTIGAGRLGGVRHKGGIGHWMHDDIGCSDGRRKPNVSDQHGNRVRAPRLVWCAQDVALSWAVDRTGLQSACRQAPMELDCGTSSRRHRDVRSSTAELDRSEPD